MGLNSKDPWNMEYYFIATTPRSVSCEYTLGDLFKNYSDSIGWVEKTLKNAFLEFFQLLPSNRINF